ncbi:2-succinyl-6-hydroxy-2,4-cyclohexadiene-1-carboxylate synthase [compost metagenome]
MEKQVHLSDRSIRIQWINHQLATQSKPLLVFLHEALGSIVQWKSFPQNLCNSLNLPGVVIERSGHGKSSSLVGERDRNYLHEYADETIQVLLEILNPDQNIILIGHSDGGSIALLLASKQLKNLQAVATMAAHTFVEQETLVGIHPAIEAFKSGKLNGLYNIHGDKTETLFYAWANTWLSSGFKSWDIRHEIQDFKQPVLAIQGFNDQYGTEEQIHSIVAGFSNRVGKMIPACGHHPHLEKSKEMVDLISEWVSKEIY